MLQFESRLTSSPEIPLRDSRFRLIRNKKSPDPARQRLRSASFRSTHCCASVTSGAQCSIAAPNASRLKSGQDGRVNQRWTISANFGNAPSQTVFRDWGSLTSNEETSWLNTQSIRNG